MWSSPPQNESKFNQAYAEARNVLLIFSVKVRNVLLIFSVKVRNVLLIFSVKVKEQWAVFIEYKCGCGGGGRRGVLLEPQCCILSAEFILLWSRPKPVTYERTVWPGEN